VCKIYQEFCWLYDVVVIVFHPYLCLILKLEHEAFMWQKHLNILIKILVVQNHFAGYFSCPIGPSVYVKGVANSHPRRLGLTLVCFLGVGCGPTWWEPSVQLDLESGTICRWTSDSRTCHTAISDGRLNHFYSVSRTQSAVWTLTVLWKCCYFLTWLCAVGFFSPPGQSRCTSCSRGTYQPTAGQADCLPCDQGLVCRLD